MFGREGSQIDDQPGWREKLADLRDAPPWVFERPEWMTESPGALLLVFAGTLFALISVLYVAVPANALPSSLPGRWTPPPTSSTVSTSTTTTTTLAPKVRQAALHKIAVAKTATLKQVFAMPVEARRHLWDYINAATESQRLDDALQQIADAPPTPPGRRWADAFLSGVLAVGLLVAAWTVSDARGRRHFAR